MRQTISGLLSPLKSLAVQDAHAPVCMTVKGCPPIAMVPVRDASPRLAVTAKLTVPLPLPLAPAVKVMPGTYRFTLRVTSGPRSTDVKGSVRISSIVLTDLYTLPDAFVGTPYSYTLSAASNAGAVTWAANGGLPAGMTLSSDGVLSGTPTQSGRRRP